MMSALNAEFRKLITVRSTYIICGIAALLVGFLAFYASGWRATPEMLAMPNLLKLQVQQAVISVGLLGSIVGVLLVTHEYRYNTIMYTLTATNSRTKVFLAKLLAVTGFSLVFSLTVAILSPALTAAGISAHGYTLAPQALPFSSLLGQVLFVGWSYAMLAFVIAMVIRMQVGVISALFVIPGVLEPLLSLALKKHASYLPYNALQSILGQENGAGHLSMAAAVGTVVIYLAIGLVAAWFLFARRDAQ